MHALTEISLLHMTLSLGQSSSCMDMVRDITLNINITNLLVDPNG